MWFGQSAPLIKGVNVTLLIKGVWVVREKGQMKKETHTILFKIIKKEVGQQVLNPTPLNPTPATCHKRKTEVALQHSESCTTETALHHSLLAWPPLQSLAVKKNFFCASFGRWKTFKIWWKMGGENFLVGLRGAKKFSIAFRIVFRILFRVFQTVFRIDLKSFRGQIRSARVPPLFAFLQCECHFYQNLRCNNRKTALQHWKSCVAGKLRFPAAFLLRISGSHV